MTGTPTPVGITADGGDFHLTQAAPSQTTNTVTLTSHASTQVGDWLIIVEEWSGPPPGNYVPPGYPPDPILTPPSGFTPKSQIYRSGFGPRTVYAFKATAAGAQTIGTWTLTTPQGSFGALVSLAAVTIRGGHLDGKPSIQGQSGSCTSLIPAAAGETFCVVWGGLYASPAPVTSTNPSMTVTGSAWGGLNTPQAGNYDYYTLTSSVGVPSAGPTGRVLGYDGNGDQESPLFAFLMTEGQPPNAPTLLGPSGNVDNTQPIVLSTAFSDPDSGDYQTQLDIQYRKVGAGSWTTVTAANTSGGTYSIPANTLNTGVQYEWQARSTDSTGKVGPWSPSGFFTPQTPPNNPVISSPTSGATVTSLPSSPLVFTATGINYLQARRCADSGGTIVYEDSGPQSAANSWGFSDPSTHLTGGTEHWQVRVAVYANLWSAWVDVQVTYSPVFPPRPTVTATPNAAAGSVSVAITNPAPGTGQVATDHVDLTRTWRGVTTTIASGLAPNATFVDYLAGPPAPGGDDNYYDAIAYSSDGVPIHSGIGFAYTGAVQSWTVPAYVYSINLQLAGAGDGNKSPGGATQLTVPVQPGDVINVYVGGAASGVTAGWNGGGAGSNGDRGGGGATDVRIGGTALSNRICVAGGAGGRFGTDIVGSQGGGTTGGAGDSGGGNGGTQSAGGTHTGSGATDGTLGQGGHGTSGFAVCGGGGGYYGGGAGANGGGGGSGYIAPTAPRGATLNGTTTLGAGNTGNGAAAIIPIFTPPA